jgi:Ca2+-binding EF-hand superfamily protein
MNKILVGGATAAVILTAGAALAQTAQTVQEEHAGRHAHMKQPVTRTDVQSHVATMFAKLDTDHDGFITKDELNAIQTQREQKMEQRATQFDPSKIFDRLDLNHDGKVTTVEAEAAHKQRVEAKGDEPAKAHATAFGGLFAHADTNKDGVITRAEFDAMGQQMKAHMEQAAVAHGGMAGHMFDAADTNKDGKVSLAEMQQTALAHFDRIDVNHNGKITRDERKQAREQLKAQQPKS